MPIRPMDIRRKEFRSGFRGYDANQVDDFLDTVADEFERNYNENQRMREETNSLRERLQQFEDLEGSIRAALVHAEQAANDLRRSANKEAEDVRQAGRRDAEFTVRDAQARSHQMLADSSSRIERVQDSYEALQDAKKSFANDFRHLLKTYMDMMENMEVSSAREIEATLRERLDTESIAVVREAADQQEPADEAAEEPAFAGQGTEEPDDSGATQRIEPATAAAVGSEENGGTGPLAESPSAPEPPPQEVPAGEQDTQVLGPEEPASTDPAAHEGDGDGSDRVVWSTESAADEPAAQEPATGESATDESATGESATGESATGEPVAEGPVTEDASGDAASEPGTEDEVGVDREETSLAEESQSHEFFDKDPTRQQGGDSRISRASRFLRRRE